MNRFDAMIHTAARAALRRQQTDGSMPAGHNGLYGDPETPARNTAHWIVTFSYCLTQLGDTTFSSPLERALEYLTKNSLRPKNATFICRTNPNKDQSNGLIGQAWIIEGLVVGGRAINHQKSLMLARTLIDLHPFEPRMKCWRIVHPDGSYANIDRTFNHQLWFAACASLLTDHRSARHEVRKFLDNLSDKRMFAILPSGRIVHALNPFPHPELIIDFSRRGINSIVNTAIPPSPTTGGAGSDHSKRVKSKTFLRAVGYQAFNLYAFAILRDQFPEHAFWNSLRLRQAVRYIESNEFTAALDRNPFGLPYNPIGFEAPYIAEHFPHWLRKPKKLVYSLLEQQLEQHWDPEQAMLSKNTHDSETLTARIYELTRCVPRQIATTSRVMN